MITYSALLKNRKVFCRLTGHTPEEFIQIFDKFKSAYEEEMRKQKFNPKRKRAWGAGRPSHLLSLEDKLVFILVYVRIYPLLFLHGLMFNLSESNAWFWVHYTLPILDKALGYAHKRPVRGQGKSLEEIISQFPELKTIGILTDGMERPTRKPKDKQKRKDWYSGKRKHHTRKNIILAKPDDSTILYLGKTQNGSKHDKPCLEEENLSWSMPGEILLGADLGFEGLKLKNFKIILPRKKPKGKELTNVQRQQNKVLAQARVRAENAICGVKRAHAIADTYRGIKEGFDDLLLSVACGLHNVRVAYRYSSNSS